MLGLGLPLAEAPFLPLGKGALILVLGGLAMLAVALLLTRRLEPPGIHAADRSRGAGAAKAAVRFSTRGSPAPAFVPSMAAGTTAWATDLEVVVQRMRLGAGLLRADARRCVLFLADCQTCRTRRGGAAGCGPERTLIESAARRRSPKARVVEIACDRSGQGACAFEVFRVPGA